MGFDLKDYVPVDERIAEFRKKHPQGSLQSRVIRWPEPDFPFVAVEAKAYRTPDDPRPGVGLAYENFPGRTPYTKDSELMNAETSAWGRAIVAVLAGESKRGPIASRDEVFRAQANQQNNPVEAPQSPTDPEGNGGAPEPSDGVEAEGVGLSPPSVLDPPLASNPQLSAIKRYQDELGWTDEALLDFAGRSSLEGLTKDEAKALMQGLSKAHAAAKTDATADSVA